MKLALSILALVVLALLLPFLMPELGKQSGVDPNANLPWQIELDAQGGSRVFGIQPGISSLEAVGQRLGNDFEVAIIAAPGETGTVEAYFSQVLLGFVQARVIATVDVPAEGVVAMRERALKAEHMESSTKKIRLHPDDLATVYRLPVKALNVIPSINLDEATVVQRFGQPAERLQVSDKRLHLLYPGKGLDVIVDTDGKELLQYVAPRDFALLREPLKAATK